MDIHSVEYYIVVKVNKLELDLYHGYIWKKMLSKKSKWQNNQSMKPFI